MSTYSENQYKQMKVIFIIVIMLHIIAMTLAASVAWGQSELRQCVIKSYTSQIGAREATGHNDGEEVEKYLLSTGLLKGYAWCAAFVNWNMIQCGVITRKSAWSPAWFPIDRIVYLRGRAIKRWPLPGDVFGIWFRSKKRIAHVGFVDTWSSGSGLVTVEGNTNRAGSREGDGVYKKWRMKSQVHSVASWINE